MLGDTEQTLTPACHEAMEAEANFAAGQLLFLADRFVQEALDSEPSLKHIQALSKSFGNTVTSTLWRFVEAAHGGRPMVALVTGHPHPEKRKQGFDPANPCRYCVQSPSFWQRFAQYDEVTLFGIVVSYSGSQRGGPLGEANAQLRDIRGDVVSFRFETFFNGHEALTLAVA